jgi:hypothetical protein
MDKEITLNVTPQDFNQFKRELLNSDENSIYDHVKLQEFAFFKTKQLLDNGKDFNGTPLTDQEKEYTRMILKQITSNLERIRIEYTS